MLFPPRIYGKIMDLSRRQKTGRAAVGQRGVAFGFSEHDPGFGANLRAPEREVGAGN